MRKGTVLVKLASVIFTEISTNTRVSFGTLVSFSRFIVTNLIFMTEPANCAMLAMARPNLWKMHILVVMGVIFKTFLNLNLYFHHVSKVF